MVAFSQRRRDVDDTLTAMLSPLKILELDVIANLLRLPAEERDRLRDRCRIAVEAGEVFGAFTPHGPVVLSTAALSALIYALNESP